MDSNAADLDFARAPLDEVVNFIDAELAELSKLLPEQRLEDNERVKPTRGVALAVRAKTLGICCQPFIKRRLCRSIRGDEY